MRQKDIIIINQTIYLFSTKTMKQICLAISCSLALLLAISCNRPANPKELSPEQQAILKRIADNMVAVEGGTFTMGCTEEQGNECSDDEKPAHQVTLSNFSIGKYEVTQEEWEAVMGKNPSHFQGARRPVEMVSWNDIQQFLERLNQLTGKNYRLPTEAEWEYAARGGKHSKGFRYSGSNDLDSVAWFDGNSMKQTHNAGQKQPNELGLYDMSGNVWEWCNDWFDATYYGGSEEQNPPGPAKGEGRVLRGGSWLLSARICRVSFRFINLPEIGNLDYGFRLVSPGS
jgi:formylglycine-generating enzyme required for sulfatase activity